MNRYDYCVPSDTVNVTGVSVTVVIIPCVPFDATPCPMTPAELGDLTPILDTSSCVSGPVPGVVIVTAVVPTPCMTCLIVTCRLPIMVASSSTVSSPALYPIDSV